MMEVEYSIGVHNRFGALNFDDEDPDDILHKPEKTKEEPSKKEKTKKQDKKDVKQATKETKPASTKKDIVNEESKKEERTESRRGGRGKSDVRRENEKNTRLANGPSERKDRDDNPPRERRGGGFGGGFNRRREGSHGDPDSPEKEGGERERGGFDRGRGGRGMRGRGGRGGFGPRGGGGGGGGGGSFGRKREFERRSGSDRSGPRLDNSSRGDRSSVKPQDKREGGGQYNWGTPTEGSGEDAEVFPQSEVTDWAEASPDPGAPKETPEDAQEEEDKENDEEKEEEEEPLKEMTLDEWKALQDKERPRASFELRKPGEGEKKGMWKNTKVYKRSDAGESEFASKRVIEERIKTSGRVKQIIPVDFKTTTEPRRGGRGGRGERGNRGGRGGRGRGRGFGGRSDGGESAMFDIHADEEFPTLS